MAKYVSLEMTGDVLSQTISEYIHTDTCSLNGNLAISTEILNACSFGLVNMSVYLFTRKREAREGEGRVRRKEGRRKREEGKKGKTSVKLLT